MSDEVREALALALDFLVEREDLLKPSVISERCEAVRSQGRPHTGRPVVLI